MRHHIPMLSEYFFQDLNGVIFVVHFIIWPLSQQTQKPQIPIAAL